MENNVIEENVREFDINVQELTENTREHINVSIEDFESLLNISIIEEQNTVEIAENNENNETQEQVSEENDENIQVETENININETNEIEQQNSITEKQDITTNNTNDINILNTLITPYTTRFSGAEWYEDVKNLDISLIGLGGIGSWTALLLGKLGVNSIDGYDFDIVEPENLGGQLYPRFSLGYTKAETTYDLVKTFTDVKTTVFHNEKFTNQKLNNITICGLDNMTARRNVFCNWNFFAHKEDCLFIDGRLSLEEMQIFCIQGNDQQNINRYKGEYLFSQLEAETTSCTTKQTAYSASMIASVIVSLVVAFTRALKSGEPLPFITYINTQNLMIKQIY